MANVICLDFDDTVVLEDTTRRIFERFAGAGWLEAEAAYQRSELSVEQFNAAAMDTVEATLDELRAFAAEVATPREGLLQLTDWAHWNDWQVVVVSNGFDFVVNDLLTKLGLDRVARHCGRARRDYRWQVHYLSPRGIEIAEGFKIAYAAAFKGAGDFVVYAGDGASDVEAAKLAAAVFARSTLWDELRNQHPRMFPFETFHDVVTVMEREAQGWLASSSSTTAAAG